MRVLPRSWLDFHLLFNDRVTECSVVPVALVLR